MQVTNLKTKKCLKCNYELPLDSFYKIKKGVSWRHSYCKHCFNRYTNSKRNKTYKGLDEISYLQLLKEQDSLCAICGNVETKVSKTGLQYRLSVDHCHETNKLRGLLCQSCNLAIGYFKDDIDRMERAIDYIRKWQSSD